MLRRVVDLPVVAVTVLEDRAHVRRRGRIALAAGLERLAVHGLAPVLVDKTLAVHVSSGSVTDVGVRRRVIEIEDTSPAASARRELVLADERLGAELGAVAGDERLAAGEVQQLERIVALALAELAADAARGRAPAADVVAALPGLRARKKKAIERAAELAERRAALDAERERLRERLARLTGGDAPERPSLLAEEQASVEVDVHSDAASESELSIEYVVPGACWRPFHTARLTPLPPPPSAEGYAPITTPARLAFETDGCIWQNTGEAWSAVELSFSTERSAALGIEPPELKSDVLRVQKKREVVEVERREQAVETAGLGVALAEVPGIDDGGKSFFMRAVARATIASDGQPHRVPLAFFEVDAELERVGTPEASPCVFLKSVQHNAGAAPILAGPIDLLLASGFVGRSRIFFTAPGERFALGWGPDPELRVKRTAVERPEEREGAFGVWRTRETEVEVRLSNLGPNERTLRLTERIPVSELEKVKIEIDAQRTTGGARPDEDGFIHFAVDLPPFGHEKLTVVYVRKRHEDVVGI